MIRRAPKSTLCPYTTLFRSTGLDDPPVRPERGVARRASEASSTRDDESKGSLRANGSGVLAVPLFRAILATVFDLVAKVMDWLIAHAFKLGLGAGAFVIVAALVLIILTLIRQLLWSSRIVEATRELELCLLVPGPFGVVTHARASIDGV